MTRNKQIVLWGVAVLVLVVGNFLVWRKEDIMQNGQLILLEVRQHDPRSLLQGDYMALQYPLAREVNTSHIPTTGTLVLSIDADDIAHYERIYAEDAPLNNNEVLLNYSVRDSDLYWGGDSYFFQEGQAEIFEQAEYAEFRLSGTGEGVLVGLRDGDLRPLLPNTP